MRLCDAPYSPAPGKRGLPLTSPWPLFSRSTPLAAGRKLASVFPARFRLYSLSRSLPMINTTGKLASFCTFLSPLAPSLRIHWPQFSRHSPLATYLLRPSLTGYCLTPTVDLSKTEQGPNLDERPLYNSVCHRTRRFRGEINPLFPLLAVRPWPFSRGPRRSTPVAPGVRAGCAMPVLCLLSLISRNSPGS